MSDNTLRFANPLAGAPTEQQQRWEDEIRVLQGSAAERAIKPPTPELDKMSAVKDKSQVIGEFLEWLQGQNIVLTRYALHTPRHHGFSTKSEPPCWGDDPDCPTAKRDPHREGQYLPMGETTQKILARYFDIDLDEMEVERASILAFLNQDR